MPTCQPSHSFPIAPPSTTSSHRHLPHTAFEPPSGDVGCRHEQPVYSAAAHGKQRNSSEALGTNHIQPAKSTRPTRSTCEVHAKYTQSTRAPHEVHAKYKRPTRRTCEAHAKYTRSTRAPRKAHLRYTRSTRAPRKVHACALCVGRVYFVCSSRVLSVRFPCT